MQKSESTFDLSEKETCLVCGRTSLKYFSRTRQCEHSAEEWAKAMVKDIAENTRHGR